MSAEDAETKAPDPDDPSGSGSAGSTPPGTVTLAQLTTGTHRYVMLDATRMSAFSPSAKASFPSPMLAGPVRRRRHRSRSFSEYWSSRSSTSPPNPHPHRSAFDALAGIVTDRPHGGDGKPVPDDMQSRLPNTEVQFDVRSLNMHLALRVREVVACAESMWGYVLDRQAELRAREYGEMGYAQAHRARADSKSSVKSQLQQFDEEIVGMTRPDFDLLLDYFQMSVNQYASQASCG